MHFSNYTYYIKKAWSILPWLIMLVLGYDLITRKDLYFSMDYLSDFSLNMETGTIISAVLALMFVNWWLESVKWRRLTRNYHTIKPLEAFKAQYAHLDFDEKGMGKARNQDLRRTYGELSVKFHEQSLEKVIAEEEG